jgi:hypothetical protein
MNLRQKFLFLEHALRPTIYAPVLNWWRSTEGFNGDDSYGHYDFRLRATAGHEYILSQRWCA